MTERNKSVRKRQRQQLKHYERNQHYKSMMKTAMNKVLSSTDRTEVEPLYRDAMSIIDSLTSKKILHRNTAARRKSELTRYVNSLS